MLHAGYTVATTANYYFLFVSTFLITITGAFITDKIVEPRLGVYRGSEIASFEGVTQQEKRGMKFAGFALLAFLFIILLLVIPEDGILRNQETGDIMGHSPFMDSLVPIIALSFLIPSIAFGYGSGVVKSEKTIVSFVSSSMASLGGYLVLAFTAAQFIAFFNYTKLGTIIAVKGAETLQTAGIGGLGLILAFVLLSAFINLFIGSASAKWAIMAPVFVPMFMQLGFTPELTQVAYRIGDSATNIISPLMTFFALVVSFASRYSNDEKEDVGMGTLISTMLPYSIGFLIIWTLLLVIWYIFGLPLGPGNVGLFMN